MIKAVIDFNQLQAMRRAAKPKRDRIAQLEAELSHTRAERDELADNNRRLAALVGELRGALEAFHKSLGDDKKAVRDAVEEWQRLHAALESAQASLEAIRRQTRKADAGAYALAEVIEAFLPEGEARNSIRFVGDALWACIDEIGAALPE